MDRNLSWIDAETLRSLVAQTAYRPVESQRSLAPSSGDASSVAAPSQPPATGLVRQPARTAVRPQASVRRASRPSLPDPDAPSIPAAPPVRTSSVEEFVPDRSASLEGRLEQLMAWACRTSGLSRAFVADEEGLLVASLDFGASAVDEAASMVELCRFRLPPEIGQADAGTLAMTAGERTRVFAWQRTRHGRTYLALFGTVSATLQGADGLCTAILDAMR